MRVPGSGPRSGLGAEPRPAILAGFPLGTGSGLGSVAVAVLLLLKSSLSFLLGETSSFISANIHVAQQP